MKNTKRKFFMISRIVFVFIMGLLVAIGIALSQVNLESLRNSVLGILRDSTGLAAEIDGNMSWKFSLRPQIQLNQVRVPAAAWSKCKHTMLADKIVVSVNLISLFHDRPTIQNVKFYDVDLCLDENAHGDLSVEFIDDKNVVDASGRGIDENQADEKIIKKYPFEDPGLGGVEIKNINAKIFGKKYHVAGFQIRYMPIHNTHEYTGWIKSDKKLFPYIISFSEYDESRDGYPARVAFSTGGKALIADLIMSRDNLMNMDFAIHGDIPDVGDVGEMLGLRWPDIPETEIDLNGTLARHKITFRKSGVKLRNTDLTFSGYMDWSRKVPAIKLNISSNRINIYQLYPELYTHSNVVLNRELNAFKDVPLYGTDLRNMNIDLKLSVKNFTAYREMVFKNVDLSAWTRNAHGRIDLKTKFADGDIRSAIDFDIEPDGRYIARMAARGDNISVGTLLSQIRTRDFISELPISIRLYNEATGTDLAGIMRTITGPVQVYSTAHGYAHSQLVANIYGTDFLTSLRHAVRDIFSSNTADKQIKISCVALNTKLRRGKLETQNGFAAQTNAINVRLAGDIDFGRETMKMSLITVPVRGIKLSLTGNVVNSIEISGNLAEPNVKISGAAVAGKVASATGLGLLLAPFTGGLGLVAGAGVGLLAGDLLENWLSDGNPCKTAMERGATPQYEDAAWLSAPIDDLIDETFNME